jgi:hypothetical protein
MARRGITYPRLNLAKSHVSEMTIGIVSNLAGEAARIVNNFVIKPETRRVQISSYRTQGKTHFFEEFATTRPDQNTAVFIIAYRHVDDSSPNARTRSDAAGSLLSLLTGLPSTDLLRCDIIFSFPGKEETTVYPLPSKLDDPRLPFDEIRGIRGVRLADGNSGALEYSFVLDRPSDRIHLNLSFSLNGGITQDTPGQALKFGTDIAQELIIPVPTRRG